MKKLFIILVTLLVTNFSFAFKSFLKPIPTVVRFTTEVQALPNNEYNLIIHAVIDKGWHIYSQKLPDEGPLPTSIVFKKNPLISMVGKTEEVGKKEDVFDPNIKITLSYFSNKVDYVQKVKLKAKIKTQMLADITFMACNENCLPPKTETLQFNFN
ncbi:MAG: protein-disulfide reductase DsbD family protein [Sediminibacterium sp.]|nr:protein-disulfide reductase DsbD family protein [Sediminibacterium sp.]